MVRELNIDLNRESGRSTYRRLAAAIRRAIHKGTLFPGDLLPSTRSLGETLGIHRHTVTAALQELVAEGWLEPIARKGYRVCTVLPTVFTRAQRTPLFAPTQRLSITLKKQLTIDGTFPDRGFRFAFQSGKPDLRIFPIDDFRRQLAECLKKGKTETLDYTDPAGFPPLVKEIGDYLRRVRGVKDRAIIVTHGSQEAIFIIAQLLLSPGDCVGVEGLGYPPAWQALRAAGAQLIPLAIDEEGLVPAALEEAVQRHNLRLLYTTALHQYPTTATMPVTRRSEIYSIAHRHKLPILEDDYDHEFHFRSHPLAPLAASDPAGIVLYVSTFSKVLFPAARIGFLAIPPDLKEPFRHFKRIQSRQNETLVQAALARWMRSGAFERHLRKMRRVYKDRRDTLIDCIHSIGSPLSVSIPDGGMAVWMDCERSSDRIAKAAAEKDVFVAPESRFHPEGRTGTHLRLGFANQTESEIRAGMKIFQEVLGAER